MKFTIIADSCCDLCGKDLTGEKIDFFTVPITLSIDGEDFPDEEGLDTKMLVEKMRKGTSIKSACPSPAKFIDIMKQHDNIICVTISNKLSGTYSSAAIAAEQIKKEFPKKKVFVFDSYSASAGVAHMLFKIKDLIEDGKTFDEIVERLNGIRMATRVRFMLQDLGNLVKTGRMKKIVGMVFGITALKLILGDNEAGEIKKHGISMGTRKGIVALSEFAKESNTIVISHCNNEEDASTLKSLLEKLGILNIKTLLMRGCASLFANDKGLLIAY